MKEIKKCSLVTIVFFLLIAEIVGKVYRNLTIHWVERYPELIVGDMIVIQTKYLQILMGILLVVGLVWLYIKLCDIVFK